MYIREDITVCVSAIGESIHRVRNIIHSLNMLKVNAVIVVQKYESFQLEWLELAKREPFHNIILSDTLGLSRSRNIAISNAKGCICYICDDDVSFSNDFVSHVIDSYNEFDCDIICFKVQDANGVNYKPYLEFKKRLTLNDLKKISSIEISFKKNKIIKEFDSDFGLGSTYPTGEEYIFLVDNFKAGLRAYFVPLVTVVHPLESSSRKLSSELLTARIKVLKRARGVFYALSFISYMSIFKRKYFSRFSDGWNKSLLISIKALF